MQNHTPMPGPKPISIELSSAQREALECILRRQHAFQNLVRRARIVLEASRGGSNAEIARRLDVNRDTVATWRRRFAKAQPRLEELPAEQLGDAIEATLSDRSRSGAPPTFSPEQRMQILALACRDPQEVGRPISHWTPRELADEAKSQGIVASISSRTIGRFLKEAGFEAPSCSVLDVSIG